MKKHVSFWVGFFSAVFLSVPLAIGVWGASKELARDLAVFFFGCIAALVISIVVALFFRDKILQRIFGATTRSLDELASSGVRCVSAVASGKLDRAEAEAEYLAKSIVSWFAWTSFYRWVISSGITLLLAFAAFTGTVLLFEQNAKIQEQTVQFEAQNEILTLSIVNELRDQMMGASTTASFASLAEFEGNETYASILSYEPGGCGLGYDPNAQLTTLPSQSTILAISSLARSGDQISEKIVEALRFLIHDSNSSVALASMIILDSLGEDYEVSFLLFDDLYVESFDELEMPHKISFGDSYIEAFNCPACEIEIFNSVVFAGGKSTFAHSSMVLGMNSGSLTNINAISALVTILDFQGRDGWIELKLSKEFLHENRAFLLLDYSGQEPCEAMSILAANSRVIKYVQ